MGGRGIVDLSLWLPVEQFHVELESALKGNAVVDPVTDIGRVADAPIALGNGLGMEGGGEGVRVIEGVAEVVLRARAEVRGKGLAIHPDLFIAFAPPGADPVTVGPVNTGAVIERQGIPHVDPLAINGDVVPHLHLRQVAADECLEVLAAPGRVKGHGPVRPLPVCDRDVIEFDLDRSGGPKVGHDELRRFPERHGPPAGHPAVLGDLTPPGPKGVDPQAGAEELPDGGPDRSFPVELGLNDCRSQGLRDVHGVDAKTQLANRPGPLYFARQGLSR